MTHSIASGTELKEGTILLNKYKVTGNLGRGSYGVVVSVVDIHTKKEFAIKKCSTSQIESTSNSGIDVPTFKELNILYRIKDDGNEDGSNNVEKNSNYIIQLFEHFQYNICDRYFVMEIADCTLKNYITYIYKTIANRKKLRSERTNEADKAKDTRIMENFKTEVFKEFQGILHNVLSGLQYLHEKHNIIHLDIKPSNILLIFRDREKRKNPIAKIVDFGVSKNLTKPTQFYVSEIGTQNYNSMEILLNLGTYSYSSDIWALGCVIYEYLTGEGLVVYRGQDKLKENIIKDVFDALGTPTERIWPSIASVREKDKELFNVKKLPRIWKELKQMHEGSPDTLQLIELTKKMLTYDPDKRITARDALLHPFFDSFQKQ